MGISLAWVAVESLSADLALARLSLKRTGMACEAPYQEVSSHALPHDWFLIVAPSCDHRIGNGKSVSQLSDGCRAVACAVEEHVNFASTEFWQGGRLVWRVEHEGIDDCENISCSGELPQRFHELLATVEPGDSDNLAGHFHMDIPLILAKELTGFRHDEADPALYATPFERLLHLEPRRSWWRPWK